MKVLVSNLSSGPLAVGAPINMNLAQGARVVVNLRDDEWNQLMRDPNVQRVVRGKLLAFKKNPTPEDMPVVLKPLAERLMEHKLQEEQAAKDREAKAAAEAKAKEEAEVKAAQEKRARALKLEEDRKAQLAKAKAEAETEELRRAELAKEQAEKAQQESQPVEPVAEDSKGEETSEIFSKVSDRISKKATSKKKVTKKKASKKKASKKKAVAKKAEVESEEKSEEKPLTLDEILKQADED